MYRARLEARDEENGGLRDGLGTSQRAVAALERRVRYLESAIATGCEPGANGQADSSTDSTLSPA